MSIQARITQVILWLFVILLGIQLGAGLYEIRVITPLVTYSPPESVIRFFSMSKTHPELAIQAGRFFWKYTSQPMGPLAIATLLIGIRSRGPQRIWMLIPAITVILVFAATYLFFVPTLRQLANSQQLGLSPEQVMAKLNLWHVLNWFRLGFIAFAFIAGLRALSLTPFVSLRPSV